MQLTVTSLDEAFVNLATDSVMSVDIELRVGGRLDVDRLTGALREAVQRHPVARARLQRSGLTDTRLTWVIPEAADHLAVEVTDEPAEVVRDRLLSLQPDLFRSPPFHVAVVRETGGDRLLFNLHHAAFDGMGAMRFITSVARAYAGEPDDLGGPPLEEARDLRGLLGSRSLSDLAPRVSKVARDATRRLRLTRVAAEPEPEAEQDAEQDAGQDSGLTYATHRLLVEADEVAGASARRPDGATINDLVLAAHALTVIRWNREREAPLGDRVSIMMPVNLRPAEWSREVVSNFASYLAIFVPTDVDDLETATALVRDETVPVKENGAAAWLVDVLEQGNRLPTALKRAMPRLLPLVDRQFVETTTLSNLGRAALPAFGEAGEVTELWFSPPSMSSGIPIAMGVAGLGGALHVGLRSQREVIGPDGLATYAEMFRRTLLD